MTGPPPQDLSAAARTRPRWASPVLVPLLILVGTGLVGLDFGPHWDEDNAWLKPLQRSFEVGAPLPGKYNYPTFGYWLTLLAAVPEIVSAKLQGIDVSEHVISTIYGQPFRLRLRLLFLLVSSLGVLWTYRLVLRWRGSPMEALLTACLLAFSWEVSYHTRWVAPDGLLMQFGALTMLGCVAAVREPNGRRWLWLAALAAGLGCGSKYPGGILLAPLFVAYLMVVAPELRARRFGRPLLLGAGLLALFVATFVATTPGSLFEYDAFKRDLDYEMVHYREAGHGVYTIEPGWEHLERMLVYFGGHVLSPYEPIAWALAGLAVLGLFAIARERFMLFVLVACFPVLYVYYMSTMVVSAIRNVLVIAPFLALFAGRGVAFVVQVARPQFLRGAVMGAAAAVMVGHALFNAHAAERTLNRSLDRSLAELGAHIAAEKGSTFALSPQIESGLSAASLLPGLGNVTAEGDASATHLAILGLECGLAYGTWVVGPIDLITFGPREINFRYYPTAWSYEQRILVMPMETARLVGLADQ